MALRLIVLALFAVVQAVAAVQFVNRVLMRLPGRWYKDVLMVVVWGLWVPGAVGLLAWQWSSPPVSGFLALQPTTPTAWALLALLGAETAFALWCLGHEIRHRANPPKPRRLLGMRSRRVGPSGATGVPGLRLNTSDLHLTEIELTLPRLPPALDGLRLVHLSDMHIESAEAVTRRALEVARDLEPDLVAVTGDFVVKRATAVLEQALDDLASIDAPLGTWVIRGNHDLWHDRDGVTQALKARGLSLLDNRGAVIDARGEQIQLVGTEHPWNHVDDWDALLNGGAERCCIVLSHTPDTFPHLAQRGADLVMAGHTHGGQWRAPLLGAVIVPSNHGRRFDQGLFEENGSALWVTRGLGSVGFPLRINCPPEMTLLILRAPADATTETARRESAA